MVIRELDGPTAGVNPVIVGTELQFGGWADDLVNKQHKTASPQTKYLMDDGLRSRVDIWSRAEILRFLQN